MRHALVDTATDFIAVKGKDCESCYEESVYDIGPNLGTGVATIDQSVNITESYGASKFYGNSATDKFCF